MNEFNLSGNKHGVVQPAAVKRRMDILNNIFNVSSSTIMHKLIQHDHISLLPYPCAYHGDRYQKRKASLNQRLLQQCQMKMVLVKGGLNILNVCLLLGG